MHQEIIQETVKTPLTVDFDIPEIKLDEDEDIDNSLRLFTENVDNQVGLDIGKQILKDFANIDNFDDVAAQWTDKTAIVIDLEEKVEKIKQELNSLPITWVADQKKKLYLGKKIDFVNENENISQRIAEQIKAALTALDALIKKDYPASYIYKTLKDEPIVRWPLVAQTVTRYIPTHKQEESRADKWEDIEKDLEITTTIN